MLTVEESYGQQPGYLMELTSTYTPSYAGLFFAPHAGSRYLQLAPQASLMGMIDQRIAPTMGNRHYLVYEPVDIQFRSVPFFLYEGFTGAYFPLLTVPAPGVPGTIFRVRGVIVDQEGDVIVCGLSGGAQSVIPGLWRLLATGTLQRFATLVGGFEMGGVGLDLETGDYIVSHTPNLWRVRPWGAVTQIASVSHVGGPSQDPETGEFLLLGAIGGTYGTVLKVTAAGAISTLTLPLGIFPAGITVDETPSGMGEYVINLGHGLARVTRATGGTVTLFTFPTVPPGRSPIAGCVDFCLEGARHLSTASMGVPNRWNLIVDFPLDPGYTYAVLVGASGIRPGITLPDQQKVRVNPDAFTVMGLTGTLAGFNGLLGVLDGRGVARGMIDLSGAGPRARGLPFWMVGVVLDPGPPVSVRRVSPPIVVQIR